MFGICPYDVGDEEMLERLLALNLERVRAPPSIAGGIYGPILVIVGGEMEGYPPNSIALAQGQEEANHDALN